MTENEISKSIVDAKQINADKRSGDGDQPVIA